MKSELPRAIERQNGEQYDLVGVASANSEIELLLKGPKKALKARGICYRGIAQALDVSETTVKRYLTGQRLRLDILERICRLADMRISDFVEFSRVDEPGLPALTHKEEENLAAEPLLACLLYLIATGHKLDSLKRDFRIGDAQMNRYLTMLDRWGLVDLFPFNRVRLRVNPLARIERGGPLARSLRDEILQIMFRKFDASDEDWTFSFAKLSPASIERVRELLRELRRVFAKIGEQDRDLQPEAAQYRGMFVLTSPFEIPVEWYPRETADLEPLDDRRRRAAASRTTP